MGLGAQVQAKALTEVGNFAAVLDLRPRHLELGLAHPAQRPLYPWTFLLHERLNVPEGEAPRDDDLDAVRVDQDSRMASAI
jgi:hypothetical protein